MMGILKRALAGKGGHGAEARWALLAAGVLLAGCSVATPPERFYSLSAGAASGPAKAVSPGAAAPLYIEVQAVSVPQQVSRNQMVVISGAGRVELLEQQRWAAPLASEIGQALSLRLSGELGAIDVFRTPVPEQAAVYRISTNVQRFESAPGQYALVDAVWSVRKVGSNTVQTCRTVAEEKVGEGYDALVAGHRRAIDRLAADIAKAVRASLSNHPGCP